MTVTSLASILVLSSFAPRPSFFSAYSDLDSCFNGVAWLCLPFFTSEADYIERTLSLQLQEMSHTLEFRHHVTHDQLWVQLKRQDIKGLIWVSHTCSNTLAYQDSLVDYQHHDINTVLRSRYADTLQFVAILACQTKRLQEFKHEIFHLNPRVHLFFPSTQSVTLKQGLLDLSAQINRYFATTHLALIEPSSQQESASHKLTITRHCLTPPCSSCCLYYNNQLLAVFPPCQDDSFLTTQTITTTIDSQIYQDDTSTFVVNSGKFNTSEFVESLGHFEFSLAQSSKTWHSMSSKTHLRENRHSLIYKEALEPSF